MELVTNFVDHVQYLDGYYEENQWTLPFKRQPTKWSNTLKQFVSKLPTNCLSVFDHLVKLALKGLRFKLEESLTY